MFLRQIIALCRSKVLQKAQMGAFRNTFDLHYLSYHLSERYLFCLFLSGRLRQVLLLIQAI